MTKTYKYSDDVMLALPTFPQVGLGVWTKKAAIIINNALNYAVYMAPMKKDVFDFEGSRKSFYDKMFDRMYKFENSPLIRAKFNVGMSLDGEVVLHGGHGEGLKSFVSSNNIKTLIAKAVIRLSNSFSEAEVLHLAKSCTAAKETFDPSIIEGKEESKTERIQVTHNELQCLHKALLGSQKHSLIKKKHPEEFAQVVGTPQQANPFVIGSISTLMESARVTERKYNEKVQAVSGAYQRKINDKYKEIEVLRGKLNEEKTQLNEQFTAELAEMKEKLEKMLFDLQGNDLKIDML